MTSRLGKVAVAIITTAVAVLLQCNVAKAQSSTLNLSDLKGAKIIGRGDTELCVVHQIVFVPSTSEVRGYICDLKNGQRHFVDSSDVFLLTFGRDGPEIRTQLTLANVTSPKK